MNYIENLVREDLATKNIWSSAYFSLSEIDQSKYKWIVTKLSKKDGIRLKKDFS